MPLCQVCTTVLEGTVWGNKPQPRVLDRAGRPPRPISNQRRHHYSLLSLLKSANEGCYICGRAFRKFDGQVHGCLNKVARCFAAGGGGGESGLTRLEGAPLPDLSQVSGSRFLDDVTSIQLFVDTAIPTVGVEVIPSRLKNSLLHLKQNCEETWSVDTKHCVDALAAQLDTYSRVTNPETRGFYLNGVIPLSITDTEPLYTITSDSTTSQETTSKINQWLEKCDTSHNHCIQHSRRTQTPWYPTRLVKIIPVAAYDTTKPPLICRIAPSSEVPAGQRYITLSHRWGPSTIARLTAANLQSWTVAGIPAQLLSQTFRDALEVAHRLGVAYIWIDSLCIIQEGDDLADWKAEAPKMHLVYANAYFNISANWGSAGLFSTRNRVELDCPKITVKILQAPSEKKLSGWSILPSIRGLLGINGDNTPHAAPEYTISAIPSVVFDIKSWEREVARSPLSTRAWVVQERLLSRRNIHFCRDEVFFECWEAIWSESCPTSIRGVAGTSDYALAFKYIPGPDKDVTAPSTTAITEKSSPQGSDDNCFTSWQHVAVEYSSCQLTFGSDKLIAIAGVASFFKSLMPHDIYVAGMWLSRLSLDMLWYCDFDPELYHPAPVSSTPNTMTNNVAYRAPSFSWASVDAPIEWRSGIRLRNVGVGSSYQTRRILPTVVHCIKYRTDTVPHIEEPLSDDIFGPMSGPLAEVKVVGRLKRISLKRFPNGSVMAESIGQSVCPPPYGWAHLDKPSHETDFPALKEGGWEVFFMPWSDSRNTWHETEGLLLELVDAAMGRFRRIGVHYFRRANEGTGTQVSEGIGTEGVYIAPQDDEASLPSWSFDVASQQHTIYII